MTVVQEEEESKSENSGERGIRVRVRRMECTRCGEVQCNYAKEQGKTSDFRTVERRD